jgi:hypothetical protein
VALSGCYSPRVRDCVDTCTTDCPEGLTCLDGYCRTPGATGSCVAGQDGSVADGPAVPECQNEDDCWDPNPCTIDLCFMGTCQHPPATDDAACDDGLFCTGLDTCQSGLCVHTGDPCGAPGACNEDADWCDCDDGNPCTGSDHGSPFGGCVGTPLSGTFCGACDSSGCAICCNGSCANGTENAYCAGCTPCSVGESCGYSAGSACGWQWCCSGP